MVSKHQPQSDPSTSFRNTKSIKPLKEESSDLKISYCSWKSNLICIRNVKNLNKKKSFYGAQLWESKAFLFSPEEKV